MELHGRDDLGLYNLAKNEAAKLGSVDLSSSFLV
jgi:hypothetical protein